MLQAKVNYYLKDDLSWQKMPEASEFIDYVNPISGYHVDKKAADVSFKKLDFYKDLDIIRIYGDKWVENPEDEVCFFFVRRGDELVALNGNSENIYEANSLGELILDEKTCIDYLKFFCMFTVGDEEGNSFYILDTKDSEFIHAYSQFEKDTLFKNYDGLKVQDQKDFFLVDARTMYGPEVYDAQYEVFADGSIVMRDDEYVRSA